MADPVKLITTTPLGNQIELTFKRWFQTKEFWIDTATTALAVIPVALDNLGAFGLSPRALTLWTIFLIVIRQIIQNYLRSISTTVVLGKDEYRAAKDEQSQASAPTPQQ